MKITIVKEHIEELIKYLQPLLPLANFHMVDYFIEKNPLQTFFGEDILNEIKEVGIKETVHSIFKDDYSGLPCLKKYVDKSKTFMLKNCPHVCYPIDDFHKKLSNIGDGDFLSLHMNVFMSYKKSHEVEILSSICNKIHFISKTSHLIDIGDGKGYLSSFLSLHHKIPVLGVEASEIKTDSAIKRVKKLTRVWNSISKNELNDKSKETSSDLYKQITMFVDDKVNVKQLISNVFLTNPGGIGLVGLHTCGDLSANSIRLFIANEDVKTLCNVGCCYHFISEKFDEDIHSNQCGFPLSQHLLMKSFVIGRAARMIAAQSIERILHQKELPNKTLFYRSLFEVLLKEKLPHLKSSQKQVGRFRKECLTFKEYVSKASQRLGIQIGITDEELMMLYTNYEPKRHDINLFYLLRSLLSSAIESLILLDRLLFLLENNYENSFLVQLFDPVISPRGYGLIAIK